MTAPPPPEPRDRVRRLFRASLYVKAADAAVELVIGALIYLVPDPDLIALAKRVTRFVFFGHPDDRIAHWLMQQADGLSMHQTSVAALYLFSHGAVKLFLVIMVLRNRIWAYPVFIVVLAALITYQIYQLTHVLSIWLLVLTIFDAVVLVLTWHEYRLRLMDERAAAARPD